MFGSHLVVLLALLGGILSSHHHESTSRSISWQNGVQAVLNLATGNDSQDWAHKALLRSVAVELPGRLSQGARVIVEDQEDFDLVNARYTNYQRPTYIAGVQVQDEQDIIETVAYARARGIPFVARAGGHALTTSLRHIQNGIVIDMRGLNYYRYDSRSKLMTVGGGITTGEFANATHAQGMEVTVGSCPCTGVLGISLGVGIGRLQGKYGYLNDNMVSVRLLLANGTIIHASKSENADVFWGLRGAGHNFGIALEAAFQVHPQRNDGNHYSIDFEFELDKVEALFARVNEVADPLPQNLAIFIIGRKKGATGGPTLNLNLVYSGPKDEAKPFVDKFRELGPVHFDHKVSQWDALPWATYNGLNNILCTRPGWARFPIKNFYGANARRYDIPTMRAFFDSWREMNEKYDGQAIFSVMFETFAQQAVRSLPSGETAFPWRDGADHFLMMEVGYKEPANEKTFDSWLSGHQDEWIKASGYGRLQQYVNYGHGSKDPPEALYGYEPWRLEKLRSLKKELDPEGWFNGYQPFD